MSLLVSSHCPRVLYVAVSASNCGQLECNVVFETTKLHIETSVDHSDGDYYYYYSCCFRHFVVVVVVHTLI